jgi:hypothetical protein
MCNRVVDSRHYLTSPSLPTLPHYLQDMKERRQDGKGVQNEAFSPGFEQGVYLLFLFENFMCVRGVCVVDAGCRGGFGPVLGLVSRGCLGSWCGGWDEVIS